MDRKSQVPSKSAARSGRGHGLVIPLKGKVTYIENLPAGSFVLQDQSGPVYVETKRIVPEFTTAQTLQLGMTVEVGGITRSGLWLLR